MSYTPNGPISVAESYRLETLRRVPGKLMTTRRHLKEARLEVERLEREERELSAQLSLAERKQEVAA